MPEGIIRDPKQNNFEADFGILVLTSTKEYCAYRKQGEDTKRILPAGWPVITSEPQTLKTTIPWDKGVTKVVNITSFPEDPPNKPILKKLKKAIKKDDLTPGTTPEYKIATYE